MTKNDLRQIFLQPAGVCAVVIGNVAMAGAGNTAAAGAAIACPL